MIPEEHQLFNFKQLKQGINHDQSSFAHPYLSSEADIVVVEEDKEDEEEEAKSSVYCSLSLSLSLDPILRRRSYGISSCDSSTTTEMFSSNSRMYLSDNHNCTDMQMI